MRVPGHKEEDREKEKQKEKVRKEKGRVRKERTPVRGAKEGLLHMSHSLAARHQAAFFCPREIQFVFLSRLLKIKSGNFRQCLLLSNAATLPCFKEIPHLFWKFMKFGRSKVTADVSSEEREPTL